MENSRLADTVILERLVSGAARLLSIQLSIEPGIVRHREGEQRQITLSVNDLQFSCRTSYSPSFA